LRSAASLPPSLQPITTKTPEPPPPCAGLRRYRVGRAARGISQYQVGNITAALDSFNKAIAMKKDCAEAVYGKAAIQFIQGKYQDSANSLQACLGDNLAKAQNRRDRFHAAAQPGRQIDSPAAGEVHKELA